MNPYHYLPPVQHNVELESQYGGSVQPKSVQTDKKGKKNHIFSDGIRANPFHKKSKKLKKKKLMTDQEKKLKKMIGDIMESDSN